MDLWVEGTRAELVTYTQTLFEDLGAEEKKRADRLASAYRLIQEAPDGTDLTFAGDFLVNNNTVPVLITNKAGEVVYKVNVDPPPAGVAERAYYDSIRRTQMSRNPPIRFEEVGQTIYYAESVRLRKLREAMDELIESFISETVINSASVPVLLIDSTATRVVKSQGIDVSKLDTPEKLQARYMAMAEDNPPIPVYLPGEGWHIVFYEESAVLTHCAISRGSVAVDRRVLLVAYLVFSASRRQNKPCLGGHGEGRAPARHAIEFVDGVVWVAGGQGRGGGGVERNGQRHRPVASGGRAFSKIGSEATLKKTIRLRWFEKPPYMHLGEQTRGDGPSWAGRGALDAQPALVELGA